MKTKKQIKPMKPWVKNIIAGLSIMLIYFLAYNSITFYHESVHEQIYNSYNITAFIELDYFSGSGRTYASEPCPTELCESLHSWNEIVAYNMSAFIFNLWSLLAVCIVVIWWKDK